MCPRSEHVRVHDCMRPYVLEPGHLKENYLQEFTTISVYDIMYVDLLNFS